MDNDAVRSADLREKAVAAICDHGFSDVGYGVEVDSANGATANSHHTDGNRQRGGGCHRIDVRIARSENTHPASERFDRGVVDDRGGFIRDVIG